MIDKYTFNNICDEANAAGVAAVEKLRVIPMIVGQETSLFSGKLDYSKPVEYVEDGVCGFAWVDVYPKNKGNTSLGKEERKVLEKAGFRKSWENSKRFCFWVSAYNQSMQKKEAYAQAFAETLRKYGISAYSGSRMD